ncbi:MAG: DUF721 domain-containing protein [Deltaproteobacteria bacterium]|nr:DUF721 domain-containing protein [Deltaproteobacteria bacterium]
MSKKSPFHPIGSILGSLMKGTKWDTKVKQYALLDQWASLVGDEIAQYASPLFWRGNTLVVGVANHPWLHELKMMEEDILEKIRQANPQLKIEKMQWILR